jgi:hypothetical protein
MRLRLRFGGLLSAIVLASSVVAGQAGWASEKHWGYVNVKGDLIIKPTYLNAGNFNSGLAPVRLHVEKDGSSDDRWGFINKQGELVVEAKFDEVLEFQEGLAAAKLPDGKWGYIDKTGAFAIAPQFERADRFSDG